MKRPVLVAALFGLFSFVIQPAQAKTLLCPDGTEQTHVREITSTSAPEVKVRTSLQADSKAWNAVIRPLTAKALKQAKEERANAMQTGIEIGCSAPQIYVGQINTTTPAAGCEHRVVLRQGDPGVSWVQVIAICQYTWMCCTEEVSSTKGYSLEGPLAGGTTTSAVTPTKIKR